MSASNESTPLDGFVLIGGASSRMGENKAFVMLGSQMLFQRAVVALSSVCPDRVTLIGRDGRASDHCDLPIISDISLGPNPQSRAPIIGLFSALIHAETPWVAVLACDLPFVTADLMLRLFDFCAVEYDAVVPVQPDGRLQPLSAFYRREPCLPVVESMIASGDMRMRSLVAGLKVRLVEFDEIADIDGSQNFFLNVNLPEDYTKAAKIEAAQAAEAKARK